jgi:hypothetical protein
MKNLLSKKPAGPGESFELGDVLGQRKAFGLIAGRCSAAEAAAIRRLREERLYAATKLNWKEFCPRHLGMCRAQADRLIQHLEEFGPDYFELAQLTRIRPEAYRAIAPAVKEGHIHFENEAIALIPENSGKVAAAVAALHDAARPAPPPAGPKEPAPANTRTGAMTTLKQRADAVVAEWAGLVGTRWTFPPAERQMMKNLIAKTRLDLERLEHQVWNQGR